MMLLLGSFALVLTPFHSSPEHPCHRHSQGPQADPPVLHPAGWGRRAVWAGQRRWVPTCQLPAVPLVPALGAPHRKRLRPHRLLPGGEAPTRLRVGEHCLQTDNSRVKKCGSKSNLAFLCSPNYEVFLWQLYSVLCTKRKNIYFYFCTKCVYYLTHLGLKRLLIKAFLCPSTFL